MKCKYCDNEVGHAVVTLCQRCWELEHRMLADTRLTQKIAKANGYDYVSSSIISTTITTLHRENLHKDAIWLRQKTTP